MLSVLKFLCLTFERPTPCSLPRAVIPLTPAYVPVSVCVDLALDSPKGSVGTSFPGEVDPCDVAVLCCYPVFQVSVVNKEMLLLLLFCLVFFLRNTVEQEVWLLDAVFACF